MGHYYDKKHGPVIEKAHTELRAREEAQREARRKEKQRSEQRPLDGEARARFISRTCLGERSDTKEYQEAYQTWVDSKKNNKYALLTIAQPAIEKWRKWNETYPGTPLPEAFVDYVIRGVYMRYETPKYSTWLSKQEREQNIRARIAPVTSDEEKVSWLWPGRFAAHDGTEGFLQMVLGESYIGKSTLFGFMAARITRGGEWPNGEGSAPEGEVLYLLGEDSKAAVHNRVRLFGGLKERVHVVQAVDIPPINTDLGEHEIKKLIVEIRPVVVFIDPLSKMLNGSYMKEQVAHDTLNVLHRLRSRTCVPIIYSWPFNRAGEYKGSQRWYTEPRGVQILKYRQATRKQNRQYTPRRLEEDKVQFEALRSYHPVPLIWMPEAQGFAWRHETDQERSEGKQEIQKWLVAKMSEYSGDSSIRVLQEDAKRAGIPWWKVTEAKRHLGLNTERKRRNGGVFGGGRWITPPSTSVDQCRPVSKGGSDSINPLEPQA